MEDPEAYVGQLVGRRHRLVAHLGSDGYSRTWLARDEEVDGEVVLQAYPLPSAAADEESEEAQQAIRRAIELPSHPGLVPVEDSIDDNGVLWVVTPYPRGIALNEWGSLSVLDAVEVAGAVLSALDILHTAGLVHRSIRPATILRSDDGEVRLTGILDGTLTGLVKRRRLADSSTAIVIAAADYFAPEVVAGQPPGPAADLFGLGVTLYEALEGQHPFARRPAFATMYAIRHEQPPDPRRAGNLKPLITRLLEKDPAQRPTIAEARRMTAEAMGPVDTWSTASGGVQPTPQTTPQTTMPAPPAMPASPLTMDRSDGGGHVSDSDGEAFLVSSVPITIYLSDSFGHERVEAALAELLRGAGIEIRDRDDPIIGSWFRRLAGRLRAAANSPAGQHVTDTAMHAAEARLVHAQDAEVTAKLMQNLGPVIESLQPYDNAVIRVGAVLVVRVEGTLSIHQLTPVQQRELDRNPKLASSPLEILAALELSTHDEAPPSLDGQQPPNAPDNPNRYPLT